jgi:hypothetical protein
VPLCAPQMSHDLIWARTPGRRVGKPGTNPMSYGTVFRLALVVLEDVCL